MTVRKGYVDTEDGQVHYRYGGDPSGEAPAIVCFHQNPSSSMMFEGVISELRDDYFVVAPDMPGYGQSYDPDDVSSFSYYTRALTEAIDNVGVNDAHIVGHHTGAGVAVELATDAPDRTKSVTLIGPPYFSQEERERLLDEVYGDTPIPPLDEDGEYLLEHWEMFEGQDASVEVKHEMLIDALVAREGTRKSVTVGRDQDLPTLFGSIEAPRLLMAARDDVLWDAFQRAREDHPDVPAVEIEGGDWEPLLDAQTVAAELESFLADQGY